MTDQAISIKPAVRARGWFDRTRLAVVAVLAVEALTISLSYQHGFEFECRAAAPVWLCAGLSAGVIRGMTAFAVLMVLVASRPMVRQALRFNNRVRAPWFAVHLAGFALIMAPWIFLTDGAAPTTVVMAFGFWLGGLGLAGAGLALAVAPWPSWVMAARGIGWVGAGAVILDGSVLGNNTVVVANSLVNRRFPPNCILQGNPARILMRRFHAADERQSDQHA